MNKDLSKLGLNLISPTEGRRKLICLGDCLISVGEKLEMKLKNTVKGSQLFNHVDRPNTYIPKRTIPE